MQVHNKFVMRNLLPVFALAVSLCAQDAVDLNVVHRIRTEAIDHSKVMDTLWNLTDLYGPRLTGSPELGRGRGLGHDDAGKVTESPTCIWKNGVFGAAMVGSRTLLGGDELHAALRAVRDGAAGMVEEHERSGVRRS